MLHMMLRYWILKEKIYTEGQRIDYVNIYDFETTQYTHNKEILMFKYSIR